MENHKTKSKWHISRVGDKWQMTKALTFDIAVRDLTLWEKIKTLRFRKQQEKKYKHLWKSVKL
jgi:hypothetical protein